ncbi:MAG: response regulator, partial [Pseudomonadota bacterium]|nr:response regulator [Pseudomonadota bacterium]
MDDTDTPIGVLIVDDEPAILRSLARVLRDLPITLKLSESPADALHLLSDWSPQIIISDQRMPLLKGTEFQAQVAQKLPDST